MGPAETTEEARELKDEFHDLSFSVHKCRRYHEKLTAFYAGWRDSLKVVTVCAGSSAFFLLFAGHERAAQVVIAVVALWGVIDLVYAPDKKADLHNQLRRKFTVLARELETEHQTPENYRRLAARRLELEIEEPPCKRLVDLQARNDECRSRGFPAKDLVPLSSLQRYFGYFFTFGLARLEKWKAAQASA